MSDQQDIPVLTDLIEKAIRIEMSDLGLEDKPEAQSQENSGTAGAFDPQFNDQSNPDTDNHFEHEPANRFVEPPRQPAESQPGQPKIGIDRSTATAHNFLEQNPALEQAIRRILDEHMELAWQEIRLAIQQDRDKS